MFSLHYKDQVLPFIREKLEKEQGRRETYIVICVLISHLSQYSITDYFYFVLCSLNSHSNMSVHKDVT